MPEAMLGVMGGPSKAEATRTIEDTGGPILWSELSSQERASDIRHYAKRYGLTANEAEAYARLAGAGLEEIESALEDWRRDHGYPAMTSPLVRGMVLDIIKGCRDPNKIRRGCK